MHDRMGERLLESKACEEDCWDSGDRLQAQEAQLGHAEWW